MISMLIAAPGASCLARALSQIVTTAGASWRDDRLTETQRSSAPGRFRRQRMIWATASSITHSPISAMSPHCSATGMNSAGGTESPSGRSQRSSDSIPTGKPVPERTIGW